MAYTLKTQPNDADVREFLSKVEPEQKREDAFVILDLMREITGEEPKMWGGSIIGFGSYAYTYPSGHSGEWMQVGFSPRKQNLSLYIMPGFKQYETLLKKLGKHKTGKSCLYINKLDDVDQGVLKSLISESVDYMRKNT